MNLELISLFDYFLIIFLTVSIVFSFIKGFIQSLLGLLTWIGAVIVTLIFYENIANYFTSYLNNISFLEKSGLSLIISTVLSIPFIFLVSLIILKKMRSMISNNFQKSSIGNILDKILGIFYGFIFGTLLVAILIITINNFSNNFETSNFIQNSYIYPFIKGLNNYLLDYLPTILEDTQEIIIENSD